jgi:magnesium transporter
MRYCRLSSSLSPHLAMTQHYLPQRSRHVDYYVNPLNSIPGTLNLPLNAPPPQITIIDYNLAKATKVTIDNPLDCAAYLDTESVSWIDVEGFGNAETWEKLNQVFQLHPIALEDIVNVPQRPKVEEYDDHLVVIARMVTLIEASDIFLSEQISFVLGKNYLLTVQEESDYDCLEGVRERIRTSKGTIRRQGADYLLYSLLDAIIDGVFPILEIYGELIQDLEGEVVANPTPKTLEKINTIKRDLLTIRRTLWPQRDAINSLIRDGNELIHDEVRIYLRDCYDHTIQIIDMVETYREIASSLTDIYLSSVSNRMNEIMKILTIISSIFIPLTFIAGIYGMNFNTEKSPYNMPELNTYWGYVVVWIVMLMIAIAMIIFFARKGWFSNLTESEEKSTFTRKFSAQRRY